MGLGVHLGCAAALAVDWPRHSLEDITFCLINDGMSSDTRFHTQPFNNQVPDGLANLNFPQVMARNDVGRTQWVVAK